MAALFADPPFVRLFRFQRHCLVVSMRLALNGENTGGCRRLNFVKLRQAHRMLEMLARFGDLDRVEAAFTARTIVSKYDCSALPSRWSWRWRRNIVGG
jgi:hypothetical protein